MPNEPNRRIEVLFHDACTRASGAERRAFLDGACGGDVDLRSRVEALLAAHEASSGFLEEPARSSPHEGPGTRIGPYKLLQEIGEGGMGVVYMAEQETPVRRKVALKVIKLGMDTKQVIARFEAERQALAMMEHVNIARVLDAGATDAGRPYFVMELVRGVPIHEYCDTHNLGTNARLGLFVDVCRAVQHAHQKGIIHRDLKPTNVLVTSHDGIPVPKIIDFGVSKATNQKLTERTLFTEYHQIIGTPEYMSPEQAEMSGLDVDTRSDIYSLGVLLYQLLTGTTPADPTALRTVAFEEMTRMIREDEPPAPSTRISKLGIQAETIAKRRRSDAGSLSRVFRGDLDWIAMKALEKDRTRRYETAAAFAEDVVRHLEDRPVEAGPPGVAYRFRKFAHRNRRVVLASLVLLAVLGLGLAGTTIGFVRARGEAERSARISDSLQEVLALTGPGRSLEAADISSVLARVRQAFGSDHETYAAVLDTLAVRLHDAGEFPAAVGLCRESLAIWEEAHGEENLHVAQTLARLGTSLRAQGEDQQAEQALRRAVEIFSGSSGGAETPGLAGYDARIELADLLANSGESAAAEDLLEASLAMLRASPTPAHYRILRTLESLAGLQFSQPAGDPTDTLRALYEESHAFYKEDSPALAVTALGYGKQLLQAGRVRDAEPYLREAVKRFEAQANPPKIYLLAARDVLFQTLRGREDSASVRESDDLLHRMIEGARGIWDAETVATNEKYYASRMLDRERYADALDAMLDAHSVLADAGKSVQERENLRDNLTALAFRTALQPGLSQKVYAKARLAAERALSEEPEHAVMIAALGAVLYRLGEFQLAAETLDRAEPLDSYPGGLARRISPADHGFRALAHARLGDMEGARAELTALRAALTVQRGSEVPPDLLREVEALVAPPSAPAEAH